MPSLGTGVFGPGADTRFSGRGPERPTNRYPSPWWDISQMEMPSTIKQLFRWCRYHGTTNSLVKATVYKMASYPLTELVFEEENDEGFNHNSKQWADLFHRSLGIQQKQLEIGLNYYTYGNAVVSLLFPFEKYLICKHCRKWHAIKKIKFQKDWNFKDWKYTLQCSKCGKSGRARVHDEYYPIYDKVRLQVWNPTDLDIDYNPITQKTRYSYSIPAPVRRRVLRRDPEYLAEMPIEVIEAVQKRVPLKLRDETLYHFKAPTPSLKSNEGGWGYPPILAALKDSFYLQVMKKAQEAIMMEHLVPLDVMYPASNDAVMNPYLHINLSDWKRNVQREVQQWRWDPNYKPILPVPIGHQRIGGDGRAMMLTQEIRVWSEHILAGMGVPQEFVFGGLSWSGSSVSLRMLENMFMAYREMHQNFIDHFLVPQIARFMRWPQAKVHMRQFRMADDVQNKQMLTSLSQMKKVSDKTLLAEFGLDAAQERRIIEQELQQTMALQQLEQSRTASIQAEVMKIQGKAQIEQQEAQMEAQQAMRAKQGMRPGMPAPPQTSMHQASPGMSPQGNVLSMAESLSKRIANMDPTMAAGVLERTRKENPQLHQLIQQALSQRQGAQNMRPLPELRPPRRQGVI